MLLSCKLSNTVLLYLEQRGEDATSLLDSVSLPEEILKDPSYWMKAAEMESFLEQVTRLSWDTNEENLLQKMAHASPQLRSWGVLDSVLRMMPRPQEILAQPSRFLSNFISPEPPVERIHREESGISFDLPISSDHYPLTTQFLKWSFETLPVYVGKEQAICDWNGIRLSIRWDSHQKTMFGESDHGHQISPELLRQIVDSLEKHQHELQQKNSELQARNDQLERTQHELEEQVRQIQVVDSAVTSSLKTLDFIDHHSIEHLRQNLGRLTDSFVRAQQLVTLLIAQDRMNPAVKEAMRRVDWERVKTQFPRTVEDCFNILEKTKETYFQEKDHV
jgi:hypothetical protein